MNAEYNYWLADDGTLDTVIIFDGVDLRYSTEYAADWRDDKGILDLDRFVADNLDDMIADSDMSERPE